MVAKANVVFSLAWECLRIQHKIPHEAMLAFMALIRSS
jgi:hypothetical protein